jgi:hypothetical protein
MSWRGTSTAYLAIALIVLSVALPFAYSCWLSTRTFVALDVPVSVARGHVQKSEFYVNLRGWYQVSIDIRSGVPVQDCPFSGSGFGLETHSRIFKDGHGRDNFLAHFYAGTKGRYKVELATLSDTGCLDTRQPRLLVWRASDYCERLYNSVRVISAIFILVGLGLLAFSLVGERDAFMAPRERTGTLRSPANDYLSRPRLFLRTKISELPSFDLFDATILLVVILPSFLIFIYAWGLDRRSVGIPVQIVRPTRFGKVSDACKRLPVLPVGLRWMETARPCLREF